MGQASRLRHRLLDRTRRGVSRLLTIGERVPGVRRAHSGVRAAERIVLQRLRTRLAELNDPRETPAEPGAGLDPPDSAAERLEALVAQSLEQRPEAAALALYDQLIDQLVPDEARILAALSDGSSAPACHLEAGERFGGVPRRVISHASRIGAGAGVMLAEHVPHYLSHLVALDLLAVGPADRSQDDVYELIENASEVRRACEEIETLHRLKPRLSRHTLALSALGRDLWAHGTRHAAQAP